MREWKEQLVAIVIVFTMRDMLLVKVRTDIINHPYIETMDECEVEERGRKKKRRTRILSLYDNHFQADQLCSKGESNIRRRALEDKDNDSIIKGRVILLRDFNSHSPE